MKVIRVDLSYNEDHRPTARVRVLVNGQHHEATATGGSPDEAVADAIQAIANDLASVAVRSITIRDVAIIKD